MSPTTPNRLPINRERIALVASFVLCLGWSALSPNDRFTWWLEALPAIAFIIILAAVWRVFPPTRITQWLVWAISMMMIVGAHYTYSEVPSFNWLRDTFDLTRNHYDRVSHFLQGVTAAMIAREILIRRGKSHGGTLLFVTALLTALGVSAGCELIEWGAAESFGGGATAFLGMQGDVWDAQKDMALALLGAFSGQILLGGRQNRQILILQERLRSAH